MLGDHLSRVDFPSNRAGMHSPSAAVVSVNWWKSNWHQPSTSEQLTMQLLTPPPCVNSSDPASRPDGAAALDRCAGGQRARTARLLHWEAKPGFWSAGETPR